MWFDNINISTGKWFDWLPNIQNQPLPDYTYGFSNNTLDAKVALRNLDTWSSRKYCLANTTTGNITWGFIDMNVYSTNDAWMSAVNNQITITKAWLYMIVWSADLVGQWTSEWIAIYVNNFEKSVSAYVDQYWITRDIRQVSVMLHLNEWDVVKLRLMAWAIYSYWPSNVFLQVAEL